MTPSPCSSQNLCTSAAVQPAIFIWCWWSPTQMAHAEAAGCPLHAAAKTCSSQLQAGVAKAQATASTIAVATCCHGLQMWHRPAAMLACNFWQVPTSPPVSQAAATLPCQG